ncbi:c-type cytochrome [Mucilaginibacter arboris]|uniref:C-type cytochrome n=1 Tax=Mucilaginibacter arboris TaxID=2682090 RepID=A0A7K1SXE2_9SPHI|nr:c-type cytochrome [Mucilaginibacter arboris]MVN22001.1 c-type cytochrome [Mucilaginibacter arboris]
MKKFLLFLLLFLVVAGIAGFSYLKFALPYAEPVSDLKITATPERIERGKYLTNHVMLCTDCHSTRNIDLYAAPVIPGTEGKGGERFDHQFGFPGEYISPNITPKHLSSWTDGEIFRTLTTGVNKYGKALFPVMPYLAYGKIDREDIYDVIAYIRTLKPIDSEQPASKSDFPMSLIINTIPQKASFTTKPAKTDTVAYGRYLITAAACTDCHTPQEKGKQIEGMTYAGGMKFQFPDVTIQSANITPDKTTGIGNWTEQQFVSKFKSYDPATHPPRRVGAGEMKTPMPWTRFAGMDTTDLKAIYQYLRTVKAVNHPTERMVVTKAE